MRVDDWILVQRSSFDIQIGEEPYHSVQVILLSSPPIFNVNMFNNYTQSVL